MTARTSSRSKASQLGLWPGPPRPERCVTPLKQPPYPPPPHLLGLRAATASDAHPPATSTGTSGTRLTSPEWQGCGTRTSSLKRPGRQSYLLLLPLLLPATWAKDCDIKEEKFIVKKSEAEAPAEAQAQECDIKEEKFVVEKEEAQECDVKFVEKPEFEEEDQDQGDDQVGHGGKNIRGGLLMGMGMKYGVKRVRPVNDDAVM